MTVMSDLSIDMQNFALSRADVLPNAQETSESPARAHVSDKTAFLLSLSLLRGVGPATLKKVAAIPDFTQLSVGELAEQLPQLHRALPSDGVWQQTKEEAARQIEIAKANHARIISAVDPEYPLLLAETLDDPFILFVKGKLAHQAGNSVAIIGTREPTRHGEQIATRLTTFFAEHEWSIVSGLAIGCDAVAHQTALALGAHTVAVLAHGLHTIAPTRHKKLADEILEQGGALVTEYHFGRDVQRQQYVKRDRIQAGMARGVVMIQSDLVGGSLHATRAALEYKRWIAVPYPTEKDLEIDEPKIQANLLIADGANDRRKELLKCSSKELESIIILRSRDDYIRMLHPEFDRIFDAPAEESFDDVERETPMASERPPLERVFVYDGSVAAVLQRGRNIFAKAREVDAMFQCLSDPTTAISPVETRVELETILLQMRNYASAAKTLIHQSDLLATLKDVLNEIERLEKLLRPEIAQSELSTPDYMQAYRDYVQTEKEFRELMGRVANALADH